MAFEDLSEEQLRTAQMNVDEHRSKEGCGPITASD